MTEMNTDVCENLKRRVFSNEKLPEYDQTVLHFCYSVEST